MSALRRWLERHGVGHLEPVLVANGIDCDVLGALTESDLAGLGLSLGDRKRMLRAIATLEKVEKAPESRHRPPEHQPYILPGDHPTERVERRQVTVAFFDLVHSSALANHLDAEDYGELLRAFQDTCLAPVARYGGFVTRFMGDGILVLFGYPRAWEDGAARAVKAALEAVAAVGQLAKKLPLLRERELAARAGIATGEVMVGDVIGGGSAEEVTVVGATPNLAARLQALAAPGTVVVSEATHALTTGAFDYEALGEHRLKGFETPMRAWRPLRAGPSSRFDAARPGQLTPFTGRGEEISLLRRRWREACGGEGRLVVLWGEPGIGKSRIVLVLSQRIADDGAIPARFQCSPHYRSSALYPFAAYLEREGGFLPEDDDETRFRKLAALLEPGRTTEPYAELARTAAVLADLLSLGVPERYRATPASPEQRREDTLAALTDLFRRLARRGPLLAVLEDAHWIDPTSLELLERLEPVIEGLPAMLLITARPEPESEADEFTPSAHPVLERLSRRAGATSLTLGRLAAAESAAIVDALCRKSPVGAEIRSRIIARGEGVPLFLEELARTVVDRPAGGDGAEIDHLVPATLHDSLMARIDRLSPAAHELAELGAVIGREFPPSLLRAATGQDTAQLHRALADLVDSELVYRRGGGDEDLHVFKHALVHDIVYRSIPRKLRRAALHERVAKALETHVSGMRERHPEMLARHFTEAGLAAEAVDYWTAAGEQAVQRSAHREAASHFGRALALVDRLPDGEARRRRELALCIDFGAAEAAVDGYAAPRRHAVYERALALCEELDNPPELLVVLSGLAGHFYVAGKLERAADYADRCLGLAERSGEPVDRIEAHRVLGELLFYLGDLGRAASHLGAAIELYDATDGAPRAYDPSDDPGAVGRMYLALCQWLAGDCTRASETCRAGLTLARAQGQSYVRGMAEFYAAWLHALRRAPREAERHAEVAAQICTEGDYTMYLGLARVIRGWASGLDRQANDALEHVERGMELIRQTDAGVCLSCFLPWQVELLLAGERVADAQPLLDEAFASAAERFYDAERLRLRARLRAALGDDEPTVEAIRREAIAVAKSQGAYSLALRAALDLVPALCDGGRRAEAEALVTELLGRFPADAGSPDLALARAILDESPKAGIASA